MDLLKSITEYLSSLLTNRPVMAVLIGLVFSLALTQWLKFILLNVNWLPDPRRWLIKAIALPVGALATFVALPSEVEVVLRALIGVSTGAVAPYVYQVGTAIIGKFWPDVRAKLSVDPYGKLDG